MGRTLQTLIVAAASATLLAGCGGGNAVHDPPVAHSSATSATHSPKPPVMPELAKEHTRAGAKAFVSYYWAVVNYAQRTLDTATLRSLANPSCDGCNGGVGVLEKIRTDRGVITGGDVDLKVLNSRSQWAGSARLMSLMLRLQVAPMLVKYPPPRATDSYPKTDEKERFLLSEQPVAWQVELIEAVK